MKNIKSDPKIILIVLTVIVPLLVNRAISAEKPSNTSYIIGAYVGLDRATLDHCRENSVTVLMPSIRWYEPASWAKDAVANAHKLGLKVIPSIASAYDGYQDKVSDFAKKHPGYWEKRQDGTLLNEGVYVNLSWGHPEVRRYKVETIGDFIISNDFDGILLDYTRFFGNKTGYADVIVNAYKEKYGIDPHTLPSDDVQWVQFRADFVTEFVAGLRAKLHAHNPKLEIIACVGPDPAESLSEVCLDWLGWINRDLIDGVVTMLYERDTNNTIRNIQITNRAIAGRVPHIPMIACWGGNLETPEMLKEGALKCLKLNCQGVAFYRGDAINELNLWPTIGEIAQWTSQDIDSLPLNYVLNSSFENDTEHYALTWSKNAATSDSIARTGTKSLKVDAPGSLLVRQIIDRGFLPNMKSLHAGLYLKTESPHPSNLRLTIDVAYSDGSHTCQVLPIVGDQTTSWQHISFAMPCDSDRVKFVILSVTADSILSPCYIDDLSVTFSQQCLAAVAPSTCAEAERPLPNTDNINLAYRQLVRASSFWENGFQPYYAVDGNLSSNDHGKHAAWHSQRPPRDQWIKIYLPNTYLISRVRLLNASAQYCYRTKDFRIEVSEDDQLYREILTGTLPDDGETWTERTFEPTSARYVRFIGINSFHPDYSVGLKEIEIY